MPDYHNDHQAWFVQSWGDGSVQIRNEATGNCLDDSFEARLRSFRCNERAYQDWYGTVWGDNTVPLVNKATGRAVDDSVEFGLCAFDRNDGPAQRW
ncbi:MAG TPA: RICIN domain-containing protein [Umezawaea sp.]|nr:RICIN domain-containing protein [Umezawaea sp.]